MAAKSASLDYWRNYFRNANSDIFSIIDSAILVAASDCPKEFRLRRDRIAEQLFSCRLTRCLGCDRVELAVADDVDGDDGEMGFKSDFSGDGRQLEAGGSKESKVSSRDDGGEMNLNQISHYSFVEAEALTDEIEQESQIVGEVLRIKEILMNFEEESDSVLFESLRRLQLMALSFGTLQETEIGKAVNGLRKHGSKRIRHFARVLVMEWKQMVDLWVKSTAAVQGAEVTPDSKNKSAVEEQEEGYEEEGLPSPPLDEAAFFTTQPTSMELSQFFDGMDDDGNPRNIGDVTKHRDNGRKTSNGNQNPTQCKEQISQEVNVLAKDNTSQMKEQVVKPNKPSSNTSSGLLRPQKLNREQKDNQQKFQPTLNKATIPKRNQQDKIKCSDEVAVQVKLEATKRKLQESYQQAENAKKQRTIQVMELCDLPKQGLGRRNTLIKSGGHNRNWANGRR